MIRGRSPDTPSRSTVTRPAPGASVVRRRKACRRLTLPKLRCRWGTGRAGTLRGADLTAAEQNAIWQHAARTAQNARDQIRSAAAVGDLGSVTDAAWAASDTLHSAAAALGSRVIRQAADSYARAARIPYARMPRPTPVGNSLRQAARLLFSAALVNPTAAQADLIVRLVALAEAVIELRRAQQQLAAQAASAARRAAEHLRGEGRRLSRRTESRATRSARLAAESFPAPPWAAPHAPGWHPTAPSSRRGPASSRPRGLVLADTTAGIPEAKPADLRTQENSTNDEGERSGTWKRTQWSKSRGCCTSAGTRSTTCCGLGQLRSIKIGKLRRITNQHLAEFIASLETASQNETG